MKKIISFFILLGLTLSAFSACSENGAFSKKETLSSGYTANGNSAVTYNFGTGTTEAPTSYNGYSSYITSFELKLLRNRFKLDTENSLAFSPAATAMQLCKLANGASNDTQTEILLALGNSLTLETSNICTSYFKSRMENVSRLSLEDSEEEPEEFVRFLNPLMYNDTSDVKSAFLQTNADYFGDDVFRFDFSADNITEKINSYFSDISGDTAVTPEQKQTLLSVTGAQFNDRWLEPYGQSNVYGGSFNAADGSVDMNFMYSDEYHIQSSRAEGIIKYTASNPLKLLLLMPKEGNNLESFVSNLDLSEYTTLLDSVDVTKKVTAAVPEFSVTSDGAAQPLSSALTKCGLYTVFTDSASYKNMSSAQNFMLNEMYDIPCGFTVNANGVSSVSQKEKALISNSKQSEKADICFDRPFVFMLIDNESSIPVIAGTFNP